LSYQFNFQTLNEDYTMKKLSFFFSIWISLFLIFSCDNPVADLQPEMLDELIHKTTPIKASRITGSVQVAWKGKGGSGMVDEKLVFVTFDALESISHSSKNEFVPAKGSFTFSVFKHDYTPEREIVAKVLDVGFSSPLDKKCGWFFAKVISDTKCDSSDDSGCSDSNHTDGGCSHDDDSTHDGGCDHDDTGTDTGCDHDDTGTDTGCDHDDTGTDTGCDHDDTGTDHDGGSGGKPDDKGGKGKLCRVGQIVVAKMHDKGTPGINDGITWKWFESLGEDFPIDIEPKHLCQKTILEGNLTVQIASQQN
jgi:hypothetical protein